MAIIELTDINVKFKNETILENVNLSLEKNKIYGFIGANGSGKSVLFKTMCGYIRPNSGKVVIDGKMLKKGYDFPDDVGILIEKPGFFWYASAYKNLKYLADINKKIDSERIKETIKLVGLDPESKKNVGKYSVGMKQRLGIAQAIMEKPSIVILDEPMNGLDTDGVKIIRELLFKLKEEGATIIISSHYMEDIKVLCDEVYRVEKKAVTKETAEQE